MCSPMAVIAGASVVGGLASSKSAKKASKEANAIARDTLNFAKQRYTDFKTNYGDLEQMVIDGAKKGVVADLSGVVSRATADVATQFTNAEEAQRREQQRLGINPNSGRADSMRRQTALSKALATAGNITINREAERRDAEEKTWNRRTAVNQLGINQMNMAANEVTNANNTLMNNYNNTAAQKTQQAGALFGMAGTVAGMGLSNPSPTTPTIQTSGIPTRNVQPYVQPPVPTPKANTLIDSITGATSPVLGQSKTPLTLLNMGGY